VQRFGRCARFVSPDVGEAVRNEHGKVYWLDLADHERTVLPYAAEEMSVARSILLRPGVDDVGLQGLSQLRDSLGDRAMTLFPYEPRFVPRDKDLFDLFDTTPDLTGADVDISRFIRDGEELDVQVFWREVPADHEPEKKTRPHRRELCTVPFHRFKDFARQSLKDRYRVWRHGYSKGPKRTTPWERLDFGNVDQVVYPGQVFLLEKAFRNRLD
jgi:CRISPR-associated endonuclease/helicase Cas3